MHDNKTSSELLIGCVKDRELVIGGLIWIGRGVGVVGLGIDVIRDALNNRLTPGTAVDLTGEGHRQNLAVNPSVSGSASRQAKNSGAWSQTCRPPSTTLRLLTNPDLFSVCLVLR